MENYGQKINVYVETIGKHPEFLVNFDNMEKHMRNKGYKLIESEMFDSLLTKWNENLISKAYEIFLPFITFSHGGHINRLPKIQDVNILWSNNMFCNTFFTSLKYFYKLNEKFSFLNLLFSLKN